MNRGTLMIRMIDIVFILLFGFVAVSQISRAEDIEPSKSTQAEKAAPDGVHVVVIGVRSDGSYSGEGGDVEFASLDAVRTYIESRQKQVAHEQKKLGVRIRANWDAPALQALRVAKLCKTLQVPKGLDVVRVRQD